MTRGPGIFVRADHLEREKAVAALVRATNAILDPMTGARGIASALLYIGQALIAIVHLDSDEKGRDLAVGELRKLIAENAP